MEKLDIKAMDIDELKEDILQLGQKPFRAIQLYEWLHQRLIRNFDEMTNIPKDFKELCKSRYELTALRPVQILISKVDSTKKFLFELQDGNIIESVLMKYKHGNSVCISSQVGCRMGCKFCASTLDGLARSLSASEMIDQIYAISIETGERVSNVVVMGSGEPLDNYKQLLSFLRVLTSEKGLNISQRNITVSTCGLVPEMKALADEKLQITLALSLHAATNEKRRELMPIANKYKIDEVVDACRYYFQKTGRRITFEYSLVKDINDKDKDAEELAQLIGDLNCHVNLIPVNPIKERNYKQSEQKNIYNFKNKLEKRQINVTIRREMGRDIEGACGQLRRHFEQTSKSE